MVTANKKLLAEHGEEIHRVAEENKTEILFEASVAGGIPIIKALREGLCANRIESIYGILNGTCNYILTRMEDEKLAFDDVLKAAQAAGYAEAEPSLDIDGHDTAHKAAVLASLAYGCHVPLDKVQVSGIRGISAVDIAYAAEMGYRIKLLAIIQGGAKGVEVSVQPTLLEHSHQLAAVSGVFNAVLVQGRCGGHDAVLWPRSGPRRDGERRGGGPGRRGAESAGGRSPARPQHGSCKRAGVVPRSGRDRGPALPAFFDEGPAGHAGARGDGAERPPDRHRFGDAEGSAPGTRNMCR